MNEALQAALEAGRAKVREITGVEKQYCPECGTEIIDVNKCTNNTCNQNVRKE